MSMLSAQCDKLRKRAKTLRQGRWSDGADDARLMEDAADTITELRGALQVASVDYRHLLDENAKLREENTRLLSCLTDDAENARQILGESRALQNDNAKLRELARKMWKPFCWAQSGYDVCLSDDEDRAIRDLARELGVEVPD